LTGLIQKAAEKLAKVVKEVAAPKDIGKAVQSRTVKKNCTVRGKSLQEKFSKAIR
jgi:hypothetical protein